MYWNDEISGFQIKTMTKLYILQKKNNKLGMLMKTEEKRKSEPGQEALNSRMSK